MPRILLINPNTTQAVTDLVATYVRRIAGDEVTFVPVTGRFGARYVSSRAAAAIAGHAALDAMAEHGGGCHAVYLACFGDPGLFALKEISPVPVVGMAETACQLAAGQGVFRSSQAARSGSRCWKNSLRPSASRSLSLGCGRSR